MVDDDPEDIYSTKRAFRKTQTPTIFHAVEGGQAFFDYLDRKAPFQNTDEYPDPHIVLLDINMPGMNGLEVLSRLRSHQTYHHLPVIMLTTSQAEHDVLQSYEKGANAFIPKPVSLDGMMEIAGQIEQYWFHLADLPIVTAA